MARIDETGLHGKIRDQPISNDLRRVLLSSAEAAGIDVVYITSGGQPGSNGKSIGSTRHNGGRAADLQLIVDGKVQTFDDEDGGEIVERFVAAAAANGATGIGAGVHYMGPATLHIGFGRSSEDRTKLVWGAGGASANAPRWLRDAASRGWNEPALAHWTWDAPVIRANETGPIARIEVPKRFSMEVIRAAQTSQRRHGIPASITLAQWALESAYGKRMPPGSNNPFGIKARSGEPSVTALTKEVINGQTVSIHAQFRAYASLDEAFVKHAELLATSHHYAKARKFKNDPDRFADALTGVYATDPNYGRLLKSIMTSNDLYRFDSVVVDDDDDDDDLFWQRGEGDRDLFPPLRIGSADGVLVTALQERLVALGYNLGKIDGKFGTLTAEALLAFQNDNGLTPSGTVDAATQAALQTAQRRRLDDARIRATEQDLANAGSRIVVDARRSRLMSWITGVLGAIGVGNSAVINASGNASAARPAMGALPETLLPFLAEVQKLDKGSSATELQRLSASAKSLAEQLTGATLPADVLQLLDQLRRTLPPDVLAKNPEIARVFETITRTSPPKASGMTTIFDVLPTFFASDSVLQMIMKGVAATAGSVLPGFGGSAAILGIGLISRLLANRIAAARVEDHQNGANIKALPR